MNEQWKPIEGFEGYEVSDQGRVRSYKRGYPKIMSPSESSNGYLKVKFSMGGVKSYHAVHRLVAKAFVDGYRDDLIVCHNDSDKTNNISSNLRWDTITSNLHDASKLGTLGRQVLSEIQVMEMRALYKTGKHSHRSLANLFGITHQAVRAILTGKTYRWVA